MLKFLLSIFALLITVLAGATDIRCKNPEYAGKQLEFYVPADPVSGQTNKWFTLSFDANGNASASVNTQKTTYTFSDFGIYRGMLFLEPGKTIELKLPPIREKSFAEEKNPYFSPVSFWFISEKGNDLNDQISAFEQRAQFLTDENFNQLYMRQSKTVFDSVKTELLQLVPQNASATLKTHANMKIGMIEAEIFRKSPKSYSGIFKKVSSDFWLHPSFTDFFNKTFDNQLRFLAQEVHGDKIKEMVAKRDLPALVSYTENEYKISGEVTDLVLLKLLHDAFYSNDFSKKSVEELLKSERFSKNKNELIRTTTKNILEKISFMQVSSAAPVICLQDLEGKKVCTDQSKDKFKYLVFADVETMVCKEHLKYLSRINELFNKNLEIYVILRDTDPATMKDFFSKNQVPAHILVDKNDVYSKEYKVRSYPQCFLLNEEHKVVFEDAKAPLNGFEQQFGTWLRNELFMRQRNQPR